jgi:hypothetical protein
MKLPGLPTSVWLLAIGATATLLIGAFAHLDPTAAPKAGPAPASDPPAVAEAEGGPEAVGEPTLPADLSPGLAEIIRLAQAHVDEGVILSYIQNSGQAYSPSAAEILYLSDLGLSQPVIAALFRGKPGEAAPVTPAMAAALPSLPKMEAPAAAAPTSDASFFYNDLAPYGSWAQAPDYGVCWQPTVETINADWRPYVDHGQWLDSDAGWYWQSDYSWGWAAFHYGRWVKEPRLGWVWVPDKAWAPAWVAWRSSGSYFGWAPLPPGVGLNVLGRLTYQGRVPGAEFAYPPSSFVFVSADSFLARNLPRHVLAGSRAAALLAGSAAVENYSIVKNKIINGGISREAVAAAGHKAVRAVALRAVSSPEAVAVTADRATLAVYRPDASAAAPAGPLQPGPFLINKPRVQPAETPPAPREDAATLAEVAPAESSFAPSLAESLEAVAPLPVHRHGQGRPDAVERPATAPPRIEGGTAGPRAAAPAVEARRTAEEPRPAPPAPVREAGPPAAPPAAASSKASK